MWKTGNKQEKYVVSKRWYVLKRNKVEKGRGKVMYVCVYGYKFR